MAWGELHHPIAPRPARPYPTGPCTGLTARWCPNCGPCTCPRQEDCPSGVAESMASSTCPLHGDRSPHPVSAPRSQVIPRSSR